MPSSLPPFLTLILPFFLGSPAPLPPCLSGLRLRTATVWGPVHPSPLISKGYVWPSTAPSHLPAASPVPPEGLSELSEQIQPRDIYPLSSRASQRSCTLPNLTQNRGQKEKSHNTAIHLLPGALSSKRTVELTEDACLSVMCILGPRVHQSQLLCAGCLLKIAGIAAKRPTATLRHNLSASNKGAHGKRRQTIRGKRGLWIDVHHSENSRSQKRPSQAC